MLSVLITFLCTLLGVMKEGRCDINWTGGAVDITASMLASHFRSSYQKKSRIER